MRLYKGQNTHEKGEEGTIYDPQIQVLRWVF